MCRAFRSWLTGLALAAVLAAACGGDASVSDDELGIEPGATATTVDDHGRGDGAADNCTPSGTALTVTVENLRLDRSCLAAPANQAFTLTFESKDSVNHNLVLLESHSSLEPFFRGEIFTGPGRRVYNVAAVARPGRYAFHCEIHPSQVQGTFIVA